ncbi:lytic transglycosylase domain-containing protein [Streptomyces smyrnaeus]|uniref:lytic transglycosylase domain-containing protein n=1 Tax=Streptomyces smyrnaeus TaxID=1387713 RepID=UPI0027DE4805|nr:lytic transglycosylase domain-containing protein [Streptomyces smyrnaeus]
MRDHGRPGAVSLDGSVVEVRMSGAEGGRPWRRWVPPLVVLLLWGTARVGKGAASRIPAGRGVRYDPARYAAQVREHAKQAGINPQLLMAILCNEAYKPHGPALERCWQRLKPGSSFGIANMHRAAFDATKRGRDFASRRWEELPDDRDLALRAAAWHLHDLAARLGTGGGAGSGLSRDELLALGYNAGAGNMLAFARGVRPGRTARSYLRRLRANWSRAHEAVRS